MSAAVDPAEETPSTSGWYPYFPAATMVGTKHQALPRPDSIDGPSLFRSGQPSDQDHDPRAQKKQAQADHCALPARQTSTEMPLLCH
jgi:hypothetical protein